MAEMADIDTATAAPPGVEVGAVEAPAPHRGARPHRGRHWIQRWNPEDETFWATQGRRVARRNLAWSILAENLGFSVWQLWSVVTVSLVAAGFAFNVDQLFWLVSLPSLVGATLRFPYTFAVPRFGGRTWTTISAVLLLMPVALLTWCVTHPGTPFWMFALAAATAGVGGGNFASSMANISFFYPERCKGFALGLNAAGGNVGVAVVQLVVPLVVAAGAAALVGGAQGGGLHLQNAALLWVPFILVAAVGAWLFMDNLATARSTFRDQVVVARRPHTWLMSLLYVGTFGSFIGYSAGLPLLTKTQFPDQPAARYAFLGALVGSLARPLGGWLADRFGGSRVTLVDFGVMLLGVAGVATGLHQHDYAVFLGSFLLLFVATGIGNGATFRMIPVIFRAQALRRLEASTPAGRDLALSVGRREAAAVLGFTSAIGAYGGFLIPKSYGTSIAHTGGVGAALAAFAAFYVVCAAVTWWCYVRRGSALSGSQA